MAIVVATRMHIRRFWHVPRFLLGSMRVAWQAHRTPGFLGGRMRAEPGGGGYWTLTVWESGRAMAAFRDAGLHARLAPMAARWADEAVFGIWQCPDARAPEWRDAAARMAEHPNFAPLDRPAGAHREERVRRPRWFGLDLSIPRARANAVHEAASLGREAAA